MKKKKAISGLQQSFQDWSTHAAKSFSDGYFGWFKLVLKDLMVSLSWSNPLSIDIMSLDADDDSRSVKLSVLVSELIKSANEDADLDDGPKILARAADELDALARKLRIESKKLLGKVQP